MRDTTAFELDGKFDVGIEICAGDGMSSVNANRSISGAGQLQLDDGGTSAAAL